MVSGAEMPVIPPAERSIGQLVADTLRFYGGRFWASLALGVGPAALLAVAAQLETVAAVVVYAVGAALVYTGGYVAASALVAGVRPARRTLASAMAAGVLVFVPAPVLSVAFILPGVIWLGLFGLAVPAAVVEDLAVAAALRRGFALGRADPVHAIAAVGTLGLLVTLTGQVMAFVIAGASGQALEIAAYLATLVLTPILFLGAAHLYDDQVARTAVESKPTPSKEA